MKLFSRGVNLYFHHDTILNRFIGQRTQRIWVYQRWCNSRNILHSLGHPSIKSSLSPSVPLTQIAPSANALSISLVLSLSLQFSLFLYSYLSISIVLSQSLQFSLSIQFSLYLFSSLYLLFFLSLYFFLSPQFYISLLVYLIQQETLSLE